MEDHCRHKVSQSAIVTFTINMKLTIVIFTIDMKSVKVPLLLLLLMMCLRKRVGMLPKCGFTELLCSDCIGQHYFDTATALTKLNLKKLPTQAYTH